MKQNFQSLFNSGIQALKSCDNNIKDSIEFPNCSSKQLLNEIIIENSLFPSPEIEDILQSQSKHYFNEGDEKSAILSLLESQGIPFRHLVLRQTQRRIRSQEEASKRKQSDAVIDKSDIAMEKCISFKSSNCHEALVEEIKSLPNTWKFIHISIPSFKSCFKETPSDEALSDINFPLTIASVLCGENPEYNLVNVPALENDGNPSIMLVLYKLITDHLYMYKKKENFNRDIFESERKTLETEIKVLMHTIENSWLGFAKICLLGTPVSDERAQIIADKVQEIIEDMSLEKSSKTWLFTLLDGGSFLKPEEMHKACGKFSKRSTEISKLKKIIYDFLEVYPSENVRRNPVVFSLDKEIQNVPWESLSILKNQPCSRIPCLHFLAGLYKSHKMSDFSVVKSNIKKDQIYYLLNPNSDLPKTQERLKEPLEKIGTGKVGKWPTSNEITKVLIQNDAFMYIGHGYRLKSISSFDIEKLKVRTLALILGCKSGKLERLDRSLDPIGIVTSYLVASTPCLLGFLWSVTDRDLDKWTINFLNHWLYKRNEFVRSVAEMRNEFSTFMNGLSTVVYGLPTLNL